MSKTYKYFLSNSNSDYCNKLDSEIITIPCHEVCKMINGKRVIFYRERWCKLFEKDEYWFRIYLSDNLTSVVRDVESLFRNFSVDSIKRTLRNYPTLINHFFSDNYRATPSLRKNDQDNRANLCIIEKGSNDIVMSHEAGHIQRLIEIANKIENECRNFHYSAEHLELSEARKLDIEYQKSVEEYKRKKRNQPKPSKASVAIERGIMWIGIFGLKYAARSFGANLDLDFDVDTDFDTDVDVDLDTDVDYDSDGNSYLDDNGSSITYGSNISFGASNGYTTTDLTAHIVTESGRDLGNKTIYLKDGVKYFDNNGTKIKLPAINSCEKSGGVLFWHRK